MDCSLPGSSVHGISQARILERVTISSSRGLPTQGSDPRLFYLLHWQAGSLPLSHLGSPNDGWVKVPGILQNLGIAIRSQNTQM